MNGTVAVSHPGRNAVRFVVSAGLAATLLALALPRVAGTSVHEVAAALGTLSGRRLGELALLWFAGIFVHSFVLNCSLPGLTRRRALMLNLTGSAVSNVLPFGGAAGMSLNFVMIRSWGFGASAFAAFTFVTNLWVVLLKLALPALALAVLVTSATPVSGSMYWTALVAALGLAAVVSVLVAGLVSRRAAERWAGVMAGLGSRARRSADPHRLAADLLDWRDRVAAVAGERWGQLSLGMVGYAALQALLLWACTDAVGAHLGVVQVLAGYAVDRILTLIVLTPGGSGFTEAGTAAALVALGGSPAAVAAGVLLYRGFTFALEIPVGGLLLGGWLVRRRLVPGGAVA